MSFPAALRVAIENTAHNYPLSELKRATQALSQRYQRGNAEGRQYVQRDIERCAYAATRMPATYAAANWVFTELRRRLPAEQFTSLLDLGAGTGAASWAATENFSELRQITLVEQDRGLIQLGRELAQSSDSEALRTAAWQLAYLQQLSQWPPHDLVVSSYALGELEPEVAGRLIRTVWQATQKVLVLIEPGTVRGFATVRQLRDVLISLGGDLVAPCPHALNCPLAEQDWCHFAARVARSALQRHLKSGALGYEDEKFSYIIFAKYPAPKVAARVLRHPQHQPGLVQLQLCTVTGQETVTINKRDQAAWKRARKIAWGEAWNDSGSSKKEKP